LKLSVRDMRALVSTLNEDGSSVVSAGGEMIGHVHGRNTCAVVRDPNDYFIQLSHRKRYSRG
jgi:hypothetical protein